MTSDILISHIQIPHYSDQNEFDDHLFENKILDEEEPPYENCDLFRNILNNSFRCQKGNFKNNLSDNFMINTNINHCVSPDLTSKNKCEQDRPIEKENIYENVHFIKKYMNLPLNNESNPNFDSSHENNKIEKPLKNNYRSTLSLVIGKPCNGNSRSLEVIKSSDVLPCNGEFDHDESEDDGSFKSSYAKSLMDSYHRHSKSPSDITQTSPLTHFSRLSSPSSDQDDSFKSIHVESLNSNLFFTENYAIAKNTSKSNQPSQTPTDINSLSSSSNAVIQLEQKICLLNENICNKDKELEKLKKDLISLRLEFNRIKAENRSLKVAQNLSLRNSPNPNGESQPSSLTSLSANSDTWTLQQQVISLNTQLEKAELSRHAYEAASRQLVHFLQTINSTLNTVAGTDFTNNNSIIPNCFSPFTTNDMLNNLESALTQQRLKKAESSRRSESPIVRPHWFETNRDGSFISNGSVDHSYIDSSLGHPDIIHSPSDIRSSNNSHKYLKKDRRDKINRNPMTSSNSCLRVNELIVDKPKRDLPLRTNSIPQKFFSGTKKSLVRSESVNDIPTEQVSHVPRVSRAMSTHCVNKMDLNEGGEDHINNNKSRSSHRLVSAKAKGFFTSLRSIFKNDNEKSPIDSNGFPGRSKLTLPLKYRTSKAKYDMQNMINAQPSHNGISNFHKKNNSVKDETKINHNADVSFETKKSLQNSIFYVPCFPNDITIDDNEIDISAEDTLVDSLSGHIEVDTCKEAQMTLSSISSKPDEFDNRTHERLSHENQNYSSNDNSNDLNKDSHSTEDLELSGPQEISVTLSFHQENSDEMDSGTYNCSPLTGDGYCTAGKAWNPVDNKVTSCTNKPGGGFSYLDKISKSLSPNKNKKDPLSSDKLGTGKSTNHNSQVLPHNLDVTGFCETNSQTNCSKKTVKFADGTSINIRVSCGISTKNFETNSNTNNIKETCAKSTSTMGSNKIVQKHLKGFNSKSLKQALWKLARSSYRDPGCRVEFV